MKRYILAAFSLSVALVPMVNAEDQDQVKPPKNKPRPQQAAQAYVAPRAVPKAQANPPGAAVNPRVNKWQQPQNQSNIQKTPRVYPNADVPRSNRWQQNQVYQATPAVPPRVNAPQAGNVPRYSNRSPGAIVSQPDMPARTRNWDQNGNWNDRTRHNHAYYNTWDEVRRRHGRHYHHRDWWRSHYTRFALFGTGYYFWDNGYWFPAYGYDPAYNLYEYDEPIYAYGGLEPAQVIANVQTELQRLGYYPYAVDGTMGPMTRAAISNYQRDTGLAITSAIDEPTLQSLGLD